MSCVLSSVPGPGGVSVSEEHGYASSPAFSRARNSFKDAENCTVSSLTVAKRARLDRVRDELALTKAAVRGVVHQHSSGIWGCPRRTAKVRHAGHGVLGQTDIDQQDLLSRWLGQRMQ
jgi:hypothetical protein